MQSISSCVDDLGEMALLQSHLPFSSGSSSSNDRASGDKGDDFRLSMTEGESDDESLVAMLM